MRHAWLPLLLALTGPVQGAVVRTSSTAGPIVAGIPILRVDKPRFAVGENVLVWVGLEPAEKRGRIRKEGRDTGIIRITRPNGTVKEDRFPWPTDGPWDAETGIASYGTLGGWGLGEEKPVPGAYTVVFTYDGRQAGPITFTVEALPILKNIEQSLTFGKKGRIGRGEIVPITLTVRNGTDQTIRFPLHGTNDTMVWGHIKREDGGGSDFLFPDNILLGANRTAPTSFFDNYDWTTAAKTPTIILKPGETFRRTFALHEGFHRVIASPSPEEGIWRPGKAKVDIGITLTILIGEPGGRYAAFSPVKVPVSETETFEIVEP